MRDTNFDSLKGVVRVVPEQEGWLEKGSREEVMRVWEYSYFVFYSNGL